MMQLINECSSILDLDYEVEVSFPEETPVSVEIIEQPDPEDEDISYLEITCKHQQDNSSGTSSIKGHLVLKWNIPIADFHNLVTFPLSHEITGTLPNQPVKQVAGLGSSIPFLLFCHRDGTSRISLGLSDQITETDVQIKQETQKGFYTLSLSKPIELKEGNYTEKVQVSIKRASWQTMAGQYQQWVCKQTEQKALSFPETAYAPIFTTANIPADDLSQDMVLENAFSAFKLGFRTWITAGGWYSDAIEADEIESQAGDWQPAPSKFYDLAENVAVIQKMGMRYLLAIPAAQVGKESQAYSLDKSFLSPEKENQPRSLSPWKKKSVKAIGQTFERLLRDYSVDGFVVEGLDQIDTEPASASTDFGSAGEGLQTLLAQLTKTMAKVSPQGLLGVSGSAANPVNQANFNLNFVNDAPYNAAWNRFQIAVQRLLMPGRPIASAPLFWSLEDSLENIAVSFINILAGIPVVSMDLRNCELSHTNLIQHWIKFYNDHCETFVQGDYQPEFRNFDLPIIQFTGKKESIIALYENTPIKFDIHKKDTIWILNASTQPFVEFFPGKKMTIPVTAHNKFGESIYTRFIRFPVDRLEVEVGGYLEIGEIWKYDDDEMKSKSKKKKKEAQKSTEKNTESEETDKA